MKRILMWSALGLAGTGVAQAQSSVTVFGVMDLGIQYTNGDGGGSVKALSNGGLSTSRSDSAAPKTWAAACARASGSRAA